jgi:type I restriction enzyme S subunit
MTGFLLDQFEDLADAPGGVQRLREMILQLAVTGRLGTGDCKEKSLSAILENISINQNKSGKNGIIDKSKYEKLNWKIPENWIWSSLGNICQKISNGYSGQQMFLRL